MQPKYYLKEGEFVIEDYNNAKPFASFLPGIAGLYGKPLWAFYVNRGQCMASFGVNSKDGAIMEFYPANTAYRRTTLEGFRTFIKYRNMSGRTTVYEPFRLHSPRQTSRPKQVLYISPYEFRIEERSAEHGFRCEAVFHTIPGEDFPALARTIRVENLASEERRLEIVDGMPKISPHGLNEWFMKNMSRTIEAWMETTGAAEKRPLYRLRVDAADVSETRHIKSGNFLLSVVMASGSRPDIIVDPAVVFGASGDLTWPDGFASEDFRMPARQIDKNITPSAFSRADASVPPLKSVAISSLIGHADSPEHLRSIDRRIDPAFFDEKRSINKLETEKIARSVSVFSASANFDAYTIQTNLDNILRGGIPTPVGKSGRVVYVFNRKHGDLERDYNNFTVMPENYAQGNGNYRDANQNRRLSVWLCPSVMEKDIRDFFDLIQLDGYNPLIIKGDRFTVDRASLRKKISSRYFKKDGRKAADAFLAGEFTIGQLMDLARDLKGAGKKERLLSEVASSASCSISAEHGEGYWIDHWTYTTDLIESYLALYPERKPDLLFRDRSYRFFDNCHVVRPRSGRIVFDHNGRVRQYHSVVIDADKKALVGSRKKDPDWVRVKRGKGAVYRSTLAAKILTLVINKLASLDPAGAGIEMEADKPGWCDSMNGLPGLFGSSCCETFELARLVRFLISAVNEYKEAAVHLPHELASFMRGLKRLLENALKAGKEDRTISYWSGSNELKERYRDAVRMGIDGKEAKISHDEMLGFLLLAVRKLELGIEKAGNKDGIPYTYFINEAVGIDKKKCVKAFKARPLPLFLEGVVHALKIEGDKDRARLIYKRVKDSALYDKELGMYRLNASLADEPLEIGRSRAFTPGWLENESIWLHMEYKYLLEILKCGLYEEFFEDIGKALIPFQDGARYGRSVLENSSFLASGRFFDHGLVGNGFYARLSGATVEFLHMLHIMNLGHQPFSVKDGELFFTPSPVLKAEFFNEDERDIEFDLKGGPRRLRLPRKSYAFSLFRNTLVIYENPRMKDTFGKSRVKPVKYRLLYVSGREKDIEAGALGEPFSRDIRSGLVDKITITLE